MLTDTAEKIILQSQITLTNVTKKFVRGTREVQALEGINLKIPQGAFVVIVGPSGCGKTTLLRILSGLEKSSSGEINFIRIKNHLPLSSMVFQEQSVFPWMTVEQNVGYGLAMRGVGNAERRDIVNDFIKRIGLWQFKDSYPRELSGGMKQRVSIARAFVNDPEILLMDEPFASLDEQTKTILQEELLRIWESTFKTVVYITHSVDEALLLGDYIVVMTARPGKIKAILDVPFERPRDVYQLRRQKEYGEMVYEIWGLLRDEVTRSQREEMKK